MAALETRGVEEARIVANQRAAGKNELRQRLQSTGSDRARAVADSLAVLEKPTDCRMRLEALELLVRREIRVLVAQPDDETDGDLAVLEVVEERAAVGRRIERPAGGVHHEPQFVPLGPHLPQFLEPNAIDLRIGAVAQPVSLLELLAELPAAAFGEERV